MSKPILLIDDEEKFALMLQELLQLSGYEADYCLNPEVALVRLRKENFDLVITDYKMPQMDGAQFLQEARRINPDLPVIMISGLMNMPELIKVANIGVTLALEKPFKTEELLHHVGRFVNPAGKPAGEAAKANEVEASEINFQPVAVTVSFPSPATFLSDASEENKRFLETLWRQAATRRHLPFFAPRGAEVRLVAMEVMGWADGPAPTEAVRVDLVETRGDITRGWLLEQEPAPAALLVDLRDTPWDSEALSTLAEWIRFVEECGQDFSRTRFLYALPTGAVFDAGALGLEDAQRALVADDCPVLLSLRERVLDAAAYIGRTLAPDQRRALGRDALLRLLHYAWPGGYQELQARLGAIQAALQAGTPFGEPELRGLLGERTEDPGSVGGSLDLAGYLRRRQREYVLLHREPGEEVPSTLLRLGIDAASLDCDALLRDEILIYPELAAEPSQ